MGEYIEKAILYRKIAELEELAMQRYLDTPINSPARDRYGTQLGERTALKHLIADFPAADVAPVVHGRWELIRRMADGAEMRCSECGIEYVFNSFFRMESYPYCHCGAKMDLEEDNVPGSV